MSDKILIPNILEGLIHNLNNPLNLVLGYSNILRKNHPDSVEAKKIYDAGIRMSDMLNELYQHISERSVAALQQISLALWLTRELEYLDHYLPVKHSIRFFRNDLFEAPVQEISVPCLCQWYEDALLKLSGFWDSCDLETGVCQYQGLPALYLKPNTLMNEEQLKCMEDNPDYSVCEGGKPGIDTVVSARENTILGVIK